MKTFREQTGPLAYAKKQSYCEYDDLNEGICSSCGEPCTEVFVDCSFDYEYGSISGVYRDGYMGSDCCEAEVVEGGTSLVRKSVHVARKDHKDGKVKAGQKYRISVYRHWRKDGPSWITTEKRILAA